MRRGLGVAAALVAFAAAGCSSSPRPTPTQRLIGFNFAVADLNGWGELVTLDPKTLQAHGRILRLNDAAPADTVAAVTSPVGQLSPDRRTLALGGSSGRILLVDPARLRLTGSIPIGRADVLVSADSWARPNRLLAVYGLFSTMNTWGDSLAVIDPLARKVVKRTRLDGFVYEAEKEQDGTLVLLVSGRGARARLARVSPTGRLRSYRLPRLAPLRGVHVGTRHFIGRRTPTVTTDGHGRAFVVAEGAPLVEVDLRTGQARDHVIRLTRDSLGLPQPPGWPPGSREPELTYGRSVTWLGHGLLGIGGGVSRPVPVGGQIGERYRPYGYQVVDTRSWRVVRTMRLTGCERHFGLFVCSESVGGFPPDSKGSRGSTLLVFDRNWQLLYRKRSTTLWRDEVAGRFLAGSADGSRMSLLEPRTGRVLRRLGTMRVWPPDLLDWRAP